MRLPVTLLLPILAVAAALPAEEAAVWSGDELRRYAGKLQPNLNPDHYAIEQLGDYGSHYMLMVHREGNGPAELHAKQTDFYVVWEGSATLYIGGEIAEPNEIEPGEVRGKSIQGGQSYKLAPGSTVNIPPNTPHQVTLDDGETITYLIVKVHARD